MNMSKKILMLIVALMFIPIVVSANEKTKEVTVYCYCDYDGSPISCNESCESNKIDEAIRKDCGGRNSTVESVTYICNESRALFSSVKNNTNKKRMGSTPEEACNNFAADVGSKLEANRNLKVSAYGTCTPVKESVGEFLCEENDVLNVIRFAGYILLFVKLLVPLILIAMGTMDYFKAVTLKSDDDLSKQTSKFIKRLVIGILIFFIPTILNTFMLFISNYNEVAEKYENCTSCLLQPLSCNK